MDISDDDVSEAIKHLIEVPQLVSSVSDTVRNLKSADQYTSPKGLSFLDLKNYNLLSYVTNLIYIINQKLCGKKIENDPAIEQLVELRTVMEKMRPIEEKLKYQINKTLAAAASGNVDIKDPLQFKANPDNLENQDDADSSEEERKESKVYVPPKISAAYYDEDDSIDIRKKKVLEKAQKRALSSSMLYELRKEYDTGPEEIKETIDPYKTKLNEEMKERERYEEEYMLRLPMTKKQKHDMRQLTTVTNFNTKFEDISALEMKSDNVALKRKFSKKKAKFKNKGKKGFKKRRR